MRSWLDRAKAHLGKAQYFLSYVDGKGACRVSSRLLPHGVHRFAGDHGFWDPAEACVLHYAHGGPHEFRAKMRRLQASTGLWWRGFPCYASCRDGKEDLLERVYGGCACVGEEEGQRQVEAGLCLWAEVEDGVAVVR